MGLSLDWCVGYLLVLSIISSLVWFIMGGILFWQKSNDLMALFVGLMLLTFGGTIFLQMDLRISSSSTDFPAWQLITKLILFLSTSIYLFFFIFPDGKFVPRWSKWLLLPNAFLLILLLGNFFLPDQIPVIWYLEGNNWLFVLLFGGLLSQIYRYRRISSLVERQQTKWVVFSLLIGIGGLQVMAIILGSIEHPHILFELIWLTFMCLALLLIPVGIGVSILRYRLWQIDILINRTLVYSALTAGIIGIYVMVVGTSSLIFQGSANLFVALLATGLAAVLFQPTRQRLQAGVNRLFYGERDDPYGVINRLGERLAASVAPETTFTTIVETVGQALKLPYCAIFLNLNGEPKPAASFGLEPAPAQLLRFPLLYQAETVGELVVANRAPGEAFTRPDQKLITNLARQAGVAAKAFRLTDELQRVNIDLQRSRERLVTEREEERRRLRRDLHDGLGPTLAALALTSSAIGDLIPVNPQAAGELTAKLQNEIRATIGDIRRLVYNLRPPTLDELGLVGAIRESASQFYQLSNNPGQTSPATGIDFVIEVPFTLPPLPAAVEVAAFRIAQEALTNVVRHSGARNCLIRLSISTEKALILEVIDDGAGISPDRRRGVGLISMRERAAELGGACLVEGSSNGTGTRVFASLPLLKL
jgi:signal transduction histidine kinase